MAGRHVNYGVYILDQHSAFVGFAVLLEVILPSKSLTAINAVVRLHSQVDALVARELLVASEVFPALLTFKRTFACKL